MTEPVSKSEVFGIRCLVTGATGFIGSHIVSLLIRHRCQVAILVRPGSNCWRIQDKLPALRILEGDLATIREVRPQIRQFRPQILIHAGWQGVTEGRRNELDQINRNLHGSLDLVSLCLEGGCATCIGFGSQAEYGATDQLLFEEMPVRPDTLYGVTKLCAGLLWKQICAEAGARFGWLRLTAAYGPKDNPLNLIPYVISTLLRRGEPVLTEGNQKWDYLHVNDVAHAVLSLIQAPDAQGTFNLSSGHPVSVREICELARDRIDPSLPLGFGRKRRGPKERMFLGASSERLRSATGWEPLVSLENGIDDTIKWYAEQHRQGT